jgi:hypothetical protein
MDTMDSGLLRGGIVLNVQENKAGDIHKANSVERKRDRRSDGDTHLIQSDTSTKSKNNIGKTPNTFGLSSALVIAKNISTKKCGLQRRNALGNGLSKTLNGQVVMLESRIIGDVFESLGRMASSLQNSLLIYSKSKKASVRTVASQFAKNTTQTTLFHSPWAARIGYQISRWHAQGATWRKQHAIRSTTRGLWGCCYE